MDIPRDGRLGDWVQFEVHLPPGSAKGPLIDRPALIKAGASSAARYRLALSLSFHWFRPGTIQKPAGSGGPWLTIRDGRQYPEVSDGELASMAFPAGSARPIRKRLYDAKEALKYLITEGFAAVAPQQRIHPGPKWRGWGGKG